MWASPAAIMTALSGNREPEHRERPGRDGRHQRHQVGCRQPHAEREGERQHDADLDRGRRERLPGHPGQVGQPPGRRDQLALQRALALLGDLGLGDPQHHPGGEHQRRPRRR
jgi:hypothetical protein